MGCFLVSKFTSHRLYPSNEGHGPESPGPWLTLQVTGFICRVAPSGTTHTHITPHHKQQTTHPWTCSKLTRHKHTSHARSPTTNNTPKLYLLLLLLYTIVFTSFSNLICMNRPRATSCLVLYNQDFPAQFRSTSCETWHHLHRLIKTSLQVLSHKWQAIAFAVHGWCRHSIDSSAATAQKMPTQELAKTNLWISHLEFSSFLQMASKFLV